MRGATYTLLEKSIRRLVRDGRGVERLLFSMNVDVVGSDGGRV